MASVTGVFFVCWAPLVIYTLLYDFARSVLPERAAMASFAYTLTLLAGMITPISNPIIYSLFNEKFQYYMKKRFGKLVFCLPTKQTR